MLKIKFRIVLTVITSLAFILVFTGSMQNKNEETLLYKNSKLPVTERVKDLLNRMTLEEKIDILGGTGFATKPVERLGIPELRMSDGPLGVRWGKSTAFPAGIAMAATWDTSLINKVGSGIGRELKAKDRDVILGPCVNIARIPMGGRNFESFGEDPYLTSRMAVSYIEGVQGEGVAATVKHFAANNQEHERMFVNVKIDKRALNEIYLPAFKAAVTQAHVLAVMSAYNKLNGHYCSENDYLLKTKLKDNWKFDGLVMSDWGAVHSSIPTALGGLDLEMPTGLYLNDSTLLGKVKDGTINENIINDKVSRILTVMFKLGLFDHPRKDNSKLLNSKENREVAYKTALEGIVLLKNANSVLPLDKNKLKSIAVIGPNAAIARTGGGGSSRVSPIFSVDPLSALKNKLGKTVKINYAQGDVMDGDAAPIESKYLYLPDGKAHGLLGEYFDNQNLKDKPAFTRNDKIINFDWGQGSPKNNFPSDHFSVRWTGFLQVPESGNYVLDAISDDGVRLYIDDKLVVENWSDHSTESKSYMAALDANKKYKIKIEYYENTGDASMKMAWNKPSDDLIKQAVNVAAKSDVALLFVGTSDQIESEGHDRDNIALPGKQDDLINAVAKVNKHVVVVITSGSPVLMSKWINNVDGVLETWFAGEEIGNAAADVIMGNYNPSGKLPVTFPERWEDCSAYKTYKAQDSVSEYSDGIFVGYRHFDKNNIAPLFPFGYGLSYTKFDYSNLDVKDDSQNNELKYHIALDLKNTGKSNGAEVVQLYVTAINPKEERAPKELKAFKKVNLQAGKTENVDFVLDKNAFAYYNIGTNTWTVDPGEYEILVGSSSRDIKLKGKIVIK